MYSEQKSKRWEHVLDEEVQYEEWSKEEKPVETKPSIAPRSRVDPSTVTKERIEGGVSSPFLELKLNC
jgi:hypothetical protein